MIRKFILFLLFQPFFVVSALAATFEFDLTIDGISGDGEAMNIGFFSTGSVGDTGTGRADINESFPGDYPMTLDTSLFQASFPGIASAGSMFGNPVVHDPTAGTVTVSGNLGGITGPYSGFTLFPSAFEFTFTGAAGGPEFSTRAEIESFLDGATMAGFVSAVFFQSGDFDTGYRQRIDFSTSLTPVPLPAGGLLLLTGLAGVAMVGRRKSRKLASSRQ